VIIRNKIIIIINIRIGNDPLILKHMNFQYSCYGGTVEYREYNLEVALCMRAALHFM
jgi:hypothetical protein